MATGIAHRLYRSNIPRILMTEIREPLTVRRTVAFSEAVSTGVAEVEGVQARLVTDLGELPAVWEEKKVAVIVDPGWQSVRVLKPHVVVDAILAKRNLGTTRDEAPLVIGVGPGFEAPEGVHVVIESNRGHDLGRVIYRGTAEEYTGIPGPMMGITTDRVLRAPRAGMVKHVRQIGDVVAKGDVVLYVNEEAVVAAIDGMVRGLMREMRAEKGEKVGDIDPRGVRAYCFTITDKARAIGGGVLEAILHHYG